MTSKHSITTSIGLLFLRVGFGGYMLTHGWGKLQSLIARDFNPKFNPIGLGPELSLTLATGAEFFCAILVILGFATRLASIPLAFTMCVAAFVVHGDDPWSKKEMALLYLIPFLTLIFTGPGILSLDHKFWGRSGRQIQNSEPASLHST